MEGMADIFAIGLGECGCNLLASYIKERRESGLMPRLRGYLLMNTNNSDIKKTREKYGIPKDNTLVYGETGFGVGGKFMEGYHAVLNSKDTILAQLKELGYEGVSGFILFTSLGGGTGCGGTPALIKLLRDRFKEEERRRIFIYVVGVLPFKGQSSEALNSMWALSRLVRAQLEEEGADLIILLSNRTMLERLVQWRRGIVTDILYSRLRDIVGERNIAEIEVASSLEGESETSRIEQTFIEIVNPLAVKVIEHMLRPAVFVEGKDVFPNTDLADYARKLDPITIPALYEDAAFIPEGGNIPEQIRAMVRHTVEELSLVRVNQNPQASSAFYVISGPKEIIKIEYDIFIKEALKSYLAEGAAVTPTIVQQENATQIDLLILLGLPKLDELKDLIKEAENLIKIHSGSPLKEKWFERSKGVSKETIVSALRDVKSLLGV
ncbi:MAG: hypothetical protein ACTSYT_01550 [Candidatus Asgardarchaeia archaeon]